MREAPVAPPALAPPGAPAAAPDGEAPSRTPAVARRRLHSPDATLRELIESISGELDLRPLLSRIVHHACELLDADHGTIGLVDEGAGVVRTEAGYHMPADELGAEMPIGVGLAGEVLRRREAIVLGRYGAVPNPTQSGMLEHAVLGMPILWYDRMIGFFGIGRAERAPTGGRGRPRARPFRARDIAMLETFARHAAIAIQNARLYADARERAERLQLITRVARIVNEQLDLGEVLQRAADAVHELLGYANVAVPVIEPEDPRTLVLRTVGGHYRGIVRGEHRLPIDGGIMGAAARSGETVLVNDVERDPRYIPTPGATGIRAELAVPILLGGRVLGVLNVESDRPFRAQDAEALRVVADQLAVAIENSRLHAAATELSAISERHRIARELHDSVTQLLFSPPHIAESLTEAWRRDPAEGERRAGRLLELSRMALAEMRQLLGELRGVGDAAGGGTATGLAAVRRHGLVEALQAYVARIAGDELSVALDVSGYERQPREQEDALYRIAQEALSNVAKHAEARSAEITLATTGEGTRMAVRDDGRGFAEGVPAAELPAGGSGGYGLVTIRERAASLGGAARIESAPGIGTLVEVFVPRGRGEGR